MKNEVFSISNRAFEFQTTLNAAICTNKNGETVTIEFALNKLIQQLIDDNKEGHSIYVIGNGGSAAVASHITTDFVNACHLRAHTLHESSLITCMTNDYGHEKSFAYLVQIMMKPNDTLIAISSSGQSINICNA